MPMWLSEAVYPGLFISSAEGSREYGELKAKGIRGICAVGTALPLHFPGSFKYHQVDVLDDGTDDLLPHLPEILEFISSCLLQGNCLVHCHAGMSRSASVVMAYLMHRWHISTHLALAILRAYYKPAAPAENFLMQLKAFEAREAWPPDEVELPHRRLASIFEQAQELEFGVAESLAKAFAAEIPLRKEDESTAMGYRCVRCQKRLFTRSNVQHMSCGPFFLEHLAWMKATDYEGKLSCSCGVKLGRYTWRGQTCGCGHRQKPSFCVHRGEAGAGWLSPLCTAFAPHF